MKCGFSNKGAHVLHTHPNRFKDFKGSFDRTENARSMGM
jgi:hypothetical protein